MTFVPWNPNRPICNDCEREFPEECMSYIFPACCAPCGKLRNEAINAELAVDDEPALAKTTPSAPPALRVAS